LTDGRITEEAVKLDRRITEETAKLDTRMGTDIAALKVQIAEVKADLIRWMCIFWGGQLGAILGILCVFFK
jgi:hypothetical protein